MCADQDELVRHYIGYLKSRGRTERTAEGNRRILHSILTMLRESGHDWTPEAITEADIRFYIERSGLKQSSIRQYLSILGGFIRFYTGRDLIKNMDILWNRAEYKRLFIEKEDLRKVLPYAEPRARLAIILGAFAGMRTVEMERLTYSDVRTGSLHLFGKGHGRGLEAEQVVPQIVFDEIASFDRWKRSLDLQDLTDGHILFKIENGRMLPIPEGSAIIYRIIREAAEKAGLMMTPHSLRRLFATTLYYDMNVDAVTLKDLMRHASVRTTLDNYVQPYEMARMKRDATDKLLDLIPVN